MRVFHFLPTKYARQALESQTLKVARLNELNDPFELFAADFTDSNVRPIFRKWKRQTARKIGLLCFSLNWKSTLLWSHYADRHRGVALECEIADELIVPVRYQSTRIPLEPEKVLAGGGFSEELAEHLVSTKSQDWAYEREVRVPVELSKCIEHRGLQFEKLGRQLKIVGLVLGPLCDWSFAGIKRSLPTGYEVIVSKSRLAFRSFNIVPDRSFAPTVVSRGSTVDRPSR